MGSPTRNDEELMEWNYRWHLDWCERNGLPHLNLAAEHGAAMREALAGFAYYIRRHADRAAELAARDKHLCELVIEQGWSIDDAAKKVGVQKRRALQVLKADRERRAALSVAHAPPAKSSF